MNAKKQIKLKTGGHVLIGFLTVEFVLYNIMYVSDLLTNHWVYSIGIMFAVPGLGMRSRIQNQDKTFIHKTIQFILTFGLSIIFSERCFCVLKDRCLRAVCFACKPTHKKKIQKKKINK